jgi:homoserine dehydrogenase
MLAHHGLELAQAAETAKVALKFEAAVAGGIPVIKGLREGAAANEIARVYGILNGTCNFILSKMEAEGRDFAEVLAEAQALGLCRSRSQLRHRRRRRSAQALDPRQPRLRHAARIRRCRDQRHPPPARRRHRRSGRARLPRTPDRHCRGRPGGLFQRVHPHLVPTSHPLSHVTGATNAVVAEGNFVGRLLFQGAGAGDGPTASAVVADLIDIARGEFGPAYAMPADALAEHKPPTPASAAAAPMSASPSPTRSACWRRSRRRCATPASRSKA